MNNQPKPQASQAQTTQKPQDKGGAVRDQKSSSQPSQTGGYSQQQSTGRSGQQGLNQTGSSQSRTSEEQDTDL